VVDIKSHQPSQNKELFFFWDDDNQMEKQYKHLQTFTDQNTATLNNCFQHNSQQIRKRALTGKCGTHH